MMDFQWWLVACIWYWRTEFMSFVRLRVKLEWRTAAGQATQVSLLW